MKKYDRSEIPTFFNNFNLCKTVNPFLMKRTINSLTGENLTKEEADCVLDHLMRTFELISLNAVENIITKKQENALSQFSADFTLEEIGIFKKNLLTYVRTTKSWFKSHR